MRFSYNWLKEMVDIPVDADTLARELTMVGLQLESKQQLENDVILDFEITVNRPDCLSVYGLAREIATIFGVPVPSVAGLHSADVIRSEQNYGQYASADIQLKIMIEDTELCPRYCGQILTGVKIGPSPRWIVERLEACGLRPVNNIVDITNLVMLELGQPLHAFDFDQLAEGTIRVRKAADERLVMIDGRERLLRSPMLVIADASRPAAVAGVMGGADSEVSPGTTAILLESAYFQPASVRKTSKALELSTDASYRFERGVDYNLQAIACRRAAALIEEAAGGKVHPVLDVAPLRFVAPEIELRHERIERVLGRSDIDRSFVENTLTSLGFEMKNGRLWIVPSFRVDVQREIDLIEEIARHYGYNKFPNTLPKAERKYQSDYPTFELERALSQILRAAKLDEAYTYSLVGTGMAPEGIPLVNPISEATVRLRTSLLPGLIDSIEYNLRHRNHEVGLFEIGRVFLKEGEKVAVGMALLGEYRELKGIVESAVPALGYPQPSFQKGSVLVGDKLIGRIGQMQIDTSPAQVCEIYLSDMVALPKSRITYQPIIPFPFIERDMSFFVDDAILYADLARVFGELALPDLRSYKLLDRYQGSNTPHGKVSLTFRLLFQAESRTLTSEDVDSLYQRIVAEFVSRYGVELRK